MAENINKFMRKGRLLFVEGRLTFDQWTAQDGTKRSKHRVTVDNVQFMPGAGGPGGPAGPAGPGQGPEQPYPGDEGEPAPPPASRGPSGPGDDIPF
jgi:single-strand DNA-binding protein